MRYFAIIFILFSQSLWAQISPVPGVGANWTYASEGYFGLYSEIPYGFSVTGDTLLDGHEYKIIGEGFFRDSLNVWYCRREGQMEEYLYFDFNLNAGDTLHYHNPFIEEEWLDQAPYLLINSADSIQLLNGEWRKRMVANYENDTIWHYSMWIEGIGSTGYLFELGFMSYLIEDGSWSKLVCFEDEFGELLFEDPPGTASGIIIGEIIYENCNWYVGIEELDWLSINLFPNPATTNLNIEGEFIIDEIRIYDLIGQLVFSENLSSYSAQVDVSKLQIGVYFMNVHSRGQEVTLRFVKE